MSGLIDQASRGNLRAVKELIDAGANVDAQDKQKRTALMLASQKGHLEIVKTLVNAGVALNLQSNERGYGGNTALVYACRNGHLEVVKVLIDSGANLNLQGNELTCEGYTALIYACRNGHQKIVKALVKVGANVNIRSKEEVTALIISSEKGYLEIVKTLIEARANVNVQNTYGQTALIRASRKGHLEVVKTLIQAGANLNLQGQAEYTIEKGWTALIHASKVGHLEIVESLVDAGADPHLKTKGGWTALMHASDQGHKEVVKVLHQATESRKARGSDPSHRRSTPILIAQASRGNLKAVRDLINERANVNITDQFRDTALIGASKKGYLEIVKVLINAGANVNFQNTYGETALIHACKEGSLEITRVLIDTGADINIQNKFGQTALIRASRKGHLEIVKTLIQAGANLNLQGQAEYTIEKRWTALIHASRVGHLEIVKSLVDAGADVSLKTEGGWTALMHASDQNHKEIVKVLQAAESRAARNSDPSDRRLSAMFTSLFTALGYLSKVDGKVSQGEIGFAANLMDEMQLDAEQRRQAEDLFRMGKQAPAIALATLLSNLRNEYKNDPESLHELMRTLMQLVYLDRVISEQERLAIKEIAMHMGIAKSALSAIEDSFLSKSKDDKGSTSSSQSQHSKKDHQSAKKVETANPNHSKLVKMSADLFEISGYLAKLDGRISREEIKAITSLMDEMQLERNQRRQAENLFRRGKQASEEAMITLVSNLQDQYHETPEVLNILVMILMEIAYSDGDMTDPEQQMIRTIAMRLNLDEIALGVIEVAVCCPIQNIKYLDLDDAYKMIGVSDAASHHDIKKARLRLLRTYHPDALQAKGLPKEMLVFGKRLSQTFNLAYDRIKADRKL